MLFEWWANNTYGRHLYIGHGIYRALEAKGGPWKKADELPSQIKAVRGNSNVQGSAYYSSVCFSKNPNGWCDSLQNNYYKSPALVPPMKWIDSVPPVSPLVENLNED